LEDVQSILGCNADTLAALNAALETMKKKSELFERRGRGLLEADVLQSELNGMSKKFTSARDKCKGGKPVPEGCLSLAAQLGHTPIVALLLLKGAPPNEQDSCGRTPLHFACLGNFVKAASLLLDAEAQLDLVDWMRVSPMHVAASQPTGSMVTLLLHYPHSFFQSQNGWTPLHVASFVGNLAAVRSFVCSRSEQGMVSDLEGFSALHAAVAGGHVQVVRMLLMRGLAFGDDMLQMAHKLGRTEVLEVLRKWKQYVVAGHPYDSNVEKDLPLAVPVPDTLPEARNHHFMVEERAVEAQEGQCVTFLLRTNPPRLGSKFVVSVKVRRLAPRACASLNRAVSRMRWAILLGDRHPQVRGCGGCIGSCGK
jgi:hypothetical protein